MWVIILFSLNFSAALGTVNQALCKSICKATGLSETLLKWLSAFFIQGYTVLCVQSMLAFFPADKTQGGFLFWNLKSNLKFSLCKHPSSVHICMIKFYAF